MSRHVVLLACLAGCNVTAAKPTGGAELPARGECARGLAVVTSDYFSSEVALLVRMWPWIRKQEPVGEFARAMFELRNTLQKMAGETRGRIRAKSGTIERVKCYVGVVESTPGPSYIFAVMVNNYDGPIAPVFSALDDLFTALGRL